MQLTKTKLSVFNINLKVTMDGQTCIKLNGPFNKQTREKTYIHVHTVKVGRNGKWTVGHLMYKYM